ncbi:MAG: TRAP transporter substrate-binding protein, partial [Candidatus Eremiobacteraeota bacterium]|nr:TRAP transporter substrate-binding protein [Candidatus Eremiobacteraeota bacterium]
NELYTALQTHIAEAMESSIGVIESLRIYEVQKYLSRSHHMWSGYWVMINPDKWNSLGPAFQEIVRRNINAAAELERNDNDIQDRAVQDLLHRQGLAVNFPKPETFKAKLNANGYYQRWRNEFGEQLWTLLERYTGPLH